MLIHQSLALKSSLQSAENQTKPKPCVSAPPALCVCVCASVCTPLISQVLEPFMSEAPIPFSSPKARASTNGQPTHIWPKRIQIEKKFKPSFPHCVHNEHHFWHDTGTFYTRVFVRWIIFIPLLIGVLSFKGFVFHNNTCNSAVQLDLKGNMKNSETNELWQEC